MKNLFLWEKVVLGIVAGVSFISVFLTIGPIDAIMSLSINTLIVFGAFVVGNKIFYKISKK